MDGDAVSAFRTATMGSRRVLNDDKMDTVALSTRWSSEHKYASADRRHAVGA